MILPAIHHLPGAHGNFLVKCLNVAAGATPDQEFYTENTIGAHADFNEVIVRTTDQILPEVNVSKKVWAYITIDQSDLYKFQWHFLYASNDFGFDILKYLPSEAHNFYKNDTFMAQALIYDYRLFNINNLDSCREMYKLSFKKSSGHLIENKKVLDEWDIQITMPFHSFYNEQEFFKIVNELLEELGYTQTVSIKHHYNTFIQRKESIIKSEQRVLHAFECYKNNKSKDISDFVLYEQAYLDYLIENDIGQEIEIVYNNGYPKNTLDINPVIATKETLYEI